MSLARASIDVKARREIGRSESDESVMSPLRLARINAKRVLMTALCGRMDVTQRPDSPRSLGRRGAAHGHAVIGVAPGLFIIFRHHHFRIGHYRTVGPMC